MVNPSLNMRLPKESSRNDMFCWIAAAFRAESSGATRREDTPASTTILYFPERRLFGPICLTALSKAFCPQLHMSRPSALEDDSHQNPLNFPPSMSWMVISEKQPNELSVCRPSKPWESIR